MASSRARIPASTSRRPGASVPPFGLTRGYVSTTPDATMARSHLRAVSSFMPASRAMVGMLGKQSSVSMSMCHRRT